MKKIKNFIGGLNHCESNNYLPVYNPSTGEKISEVVSSNSKDFENCIKSSLFVHSDNKPWLRNH